MSATKLILTDEQITRLLGLAPKEAISPIQDRTVYKDVNGYFLKGVRVVVGPLTLYGDAYIERPRVRALALESAMIECSEERLRDLRQMGQDESNGFLFDLACWYLEQRFGIES